MIVPTLTYVASVNAIVHAGAKPVFVDAVQSTWQMDPVDVRRGRSRPIPRRCWPSISTAQRARWTSFSQSAEPTIFI